MGIPFERIVEEDINLGHDLVSVTNPAGGTMPGRQVSLATFYPYAVHYYGAKGDGVTDDSTAVQRAIDAASQNGGGVIYFPNGTYRLTQEIRIKAHGIKLLGESTLDAILQWDDTANRGLNVDVAVFDQITSALTVDAALGDRAVTVASGASFTVGAWAFLDDSAANTTTLQTKVKSIAGNVVTLEDALPGPLTVASAASLLSNVAHPLLKGFALRSLSLRCVTTTPANLLTLALLSRLDNMIVENCIFNGSTGPLITTRQSYQGRISRSVFSNAITVAGTGIEHQTTTGILVEGNSFEMCQFGATFASSPYCRFIGNRVNGRQTNVALGRGVRYGESSNFGVVDGNTVSDTNLYGIYFQDSSFCTCTANTVSFTGSASDTGEHGIQCGGLDAGNFCNHNTIVGNVIRGASGYGISLANATTGQTTRHAVVGNSISGCTWGALFCTGSENTFTGNQCAAPGTTVIGAILRLTFGADYNTISGNTLTNEDTSGTSGINSAGGGGHNLFDNNITTTPLYLSNTYHATDTIGATQAYVKAAVLHTPLFTTTEVATAADTVETTAWTIPVPAAALSSTSHGLRIRGTFRMAANTNGKTLRVKIGANTFTGACGGAGFSAQQYSLVVDVLVIYTAPTTCKVWVFFNSTQIATSFGSPGGTWSGVTGVDWVAGFNILLTMQNSSASAGDLTFGMGSMEYVGVPQGT